MSEHSGHLPVDGDRKALRISGWLTGVYFVIELVIGLWSGSVAVVSDAFHTFSAVGGVLIALVAQRLSQRPATAKETFGWARAEIIGALFNGLFLALMAAYVFYMGAMRLADPIELPTTVMLWVAAGGIVTELIAFWLLYRRQKTNLNIKGAFWHILQTFVGSLIIIISAVVIRLTGFLAIDPLLGMVFGVVLLWASWTIIRSALRILLQGTPEHLDLPAAIAALEEIDGVEDVHHVHAWTITSGRTVFSAHLHVADPSQHEAVLEQGTDLLTDRFDIYFSTLQIERTCPAQAATSIDITRQSERGTGSGV